VVTERYDALIAGGGLAGLSLAAHLAAGGWRDRDVLLVDDQAASGPATAWGFWSTGPGLLDAAVSRSYARVRVHAAGESRTIPLAPYRYRMVRREDLRTAVGAVLAGCPGFTQRHGSVCAIRDGAGAAEAMVDGRRVRAGWIFDSVSPAPWPEPADAHLAFTGWEVYCPDPIFDPDTPILADFRTPPGRRSARFVYVLPTDPCRALVELTEFVPRHAVPAGPGEHGRALAGYLREVLRADRYQILRTESAVLPLHARAPGRGAGRVRAIGARAGLVKASTGYGYRRIQRDCAAIAASLARHGHPDALPRPPRRYRWLDAILLDLLDRDPAQLEPSFARLFAAEPARLLRFLDEEGSLAGDARLIAGLSPGPYLRAAVTRVAVAVARPAGGTRPAA
jgi:lycopene beta-cyclase